MKVKLVVEQGARRRVMTIQSDEAVVGRGRGNTVRIPSAEVSRQHCRLLMEDGLVRVEDLGSVNGTFVNGRKIRAIEYIRPGDQLGIGPVTFVVEYELTPEALERMRQDEDPADMLELLATGEALEDEELPLLEAADDEELAEFEPIEDEVPELEPVEEEIPELEPISADELLAADAELDDAGGWHMPQGHEFRDMLSQLEDDDAPTKQRKPKRH